MVCGFEYWGRLCVCKKGVGGRGSIGGRGLEVLLS
jgi:hypothetical protein